MGLIQFAKNVGRKLDIGDEKPQQQSQGQHPQNPAQARQAANQPANQQQLAQGQERRRETALASIVKQMGFNTEGLVVDIEGDKVTLRGNVASQEEREKIVLLVGNHEGIGAVDDQLKVKSPAPEAQFYEVQSGDTLSKIAKQYYGEANKYNQVFEANRPMLKDPDEIYPGQRLRIPASTQSGKVGSVGGSDGFGGYERCFPAGTRIEMADGSLKAISEVRAGDWVRCWNHRQSALAEVQIELVLSATVDKLVRLNGRLSASPAHRIFTARGYVRFDEVQVGDSLLRSPGTIPEPVTEVESVFGSFSVFNLVVGPFACFFAEGLLVEDQIGAELTEETFGMNVEPVQLSEAL